MSAPKCLVYLKLARTEWLPSLSTKRTQPGTTSWPLLAVCVRPRLLQAVPSCPCCCLHRPACTGPAHRRCPWCCPLPASALSHQPRVSGLSEPQLGTQQSWTSQQLALPEHMALPLRQTTHPQTSGRGNQGHEKKTSTRFRKGGSGKSQAGLGREDAAVMITGPFYAT